MKDCPGLAVFHDHDVDCISDAAREFVRRVFEERIKLRPTKAKRIVVITTPRAQ